jgi:hypothetical protein
MRFAFKSRATAAIRIRASRTNGDTPEGGPDVTVVTPSFSANVVHLDGNVVVMLVSESAGRIVSLLDELTEGGPPEIVLRVSDLVSSIAQKSLFSSRLNENSERKDATSASAIRSRSSRERLRSRISPLPSILKPVSASPTAIRRAPRQLHQRATAIAWLSDRREPQSRFSPTREIR